MKRVIFAFLLLTSLNAFSQLKVMNGTGFAVSSGTTVTFIGADSLDVNSGAVFENNGILNLPFNYVIIENPGYPIFGSGKETIPFAGNTTSQVHPGNLGFRFLTMNTDTFYLERFHDTLPGVSFSTVRRYFTLKDEFNNPVTIHHPDFFADTSEAETSSEIIWHLIGSDLSSFTNYATDSSEQIYSFNSDTISTYTYFTLSGTIYSENSSHEVCQGDTLFLQISIDGAYQNNSQWIAELSDETGSFTVISDSDSSYLQNETLLFAFPTSLLPTGTDYKIRIKSPEPDWNFEISSFSIHELPAPPVISLQTDTLFVTDFPSGTILWYLDGNIISGANDSLLVAFSNGIYTAEYVSIANCSSTSDYYFNTFQITESVLQNNFLIYPNPARNFFTISNNSTMQKMEIMNSLGQILFQSLLQPGKNIIFTPSNIYPSGIYLIKIENNYLKLIIE